MSPTTLDQVPQLFQLATLYALLVLVLQHQFIVGALGPAQVVVLWGALLVLTLAARCASRALSSRMAPVERCLFVGTDASFGRLDGELSGGVRPALLVVRMRLDELRQDEHSMARLQHLIAKHDVHRVIIEPSDASAEITLEFVREAKATGARVSLLPRVLEVVGSSVEVDDIDGLTLLGVRHFGLSRSSALVKRSFDIAGAIYRQTRVGRGGQEFQIWKFRTMVPDADALKSDLRALHEAGILRGEMSLVGPRPPVSDEDVRIKGLDRRQLHLTSGMTGHWQIMGSSRVPLPEMIKLDYRYVAGWSLWSDMKILLRTVPYMIARRGL